MAWNRSSGAPKVAPKKSPSAMRGVVAGLVVVALAAACAVIFMGKGEKAVEKSTKERGLIKEVTPAATPKVEKPVEKKEEVWKPVSVRYRERYGDKPRNAARLSKVSSFKKVLDKSTVVESNGVAEARLSRYSNPLHQELAKYVIPGAFYGPPDGDISEADARKWCDEAMKYDINEPLNVLEEKHDVEDLAKEMKAFMDAGGSAQEFLNKVFERQEEESATLAEVRRQVKQYCKEGDEAMANLALEKYNEYLDTKGLPRVKMTSSMKFHLRKNKAKQGE